MKYKNSFFGTIISKGILTELHILHRIKSSMMTIGPDDGQIYKK